MSPYFSLEHVPSAQCEILVEIAAERSKQDSKWGQQDHPLHGDESRAERKAYEYLAKMACEEQSKQGKLTWENIITEEAAEAYAADNDDDARMELVQLAAVAVAAIENIDRRKATETQ